jgi:hypothetical protein
VPALVALATPRNYLVRLRNGGATGEALETAVRSALGARGTAGVAEGGAPDEFALTLARDVELGDALRALLDSDLQVLTCREERSGIEDAFLGVTRA